MLIWKELTHIRAGNRHQNLTLESTGLINEAVITHLQLEKHLLDSLRLSWLTHKNSMINHAGLRISDNLRQYKCTYSNTWSKLLAECCWPASCWFFSVVWSFWEAIKPQTPRATSPTAFYFFPYWASRGIGLPTDTLGLKCYRFLKKGAPEETHHQGLPNPSLQPGVLAWELLHVAFGCAHEKGSDEVIWASSSGRLAASFSTWTSGKCQVNYNYIAFFLLLLSVPSANIVNLNSTQMLL